MTAPNIEPVEVPLKFRQGSPFDVVIQFFSDVGKTTPLDFTGWELNMQAREGVADSGAPVVVSLSSVATSAQDARIALVPMASDGTPDLSGAEDPTQGAVRLFLSSTETASITTAKRPKKGTFPAEMIFFYDLEGTPPGGQPVALAFGVLTGTAEVTR